MWCLLNQAHHTQPAGITPSQEIKRRNTFLIKTEIMKARAARKSSNQWFWWCFLGVSVSSLLSDIQDQSKCKCNRSIPKMQILLSEWEPLQSPAQLTGKNVPKYWFYFHVETGTLNRKVCWRTASHKQQKSCSGEKRMQNQLTQQLNLGKQ